MQKLWRVVRNLGVKMSRSDGRLNSYLPSWCMVQGDESRDSGWKSQRVSLIRPLPIRPSTQLVGRSILHQDKETRPTNLCTSPKSPYVENHLGCPTADVLIIECFLRWRYHTCLQFVLYPVPSTCENSNVRLGDVLLT